MKSYRQLSEIQDDLRKRSLTCEELVEYYLSRIQAESHLNAFIEVFDTEALDKARALDQKISDNEEVGKLCGLVLGLKDIICYQGHKVSAASKTLDSFESLYNATATERVLEEDAIIIGRLNCDEFGMGSSNENSAYGPVLNPIDNQKVPGGSSGGSAVAVNMDLCHASLASDTGGSIRQPASFCGVVGLKPTYGRVSRYGLIAYASSFDQIGTLTKSAADAALLLEVMAGEDAYDSTVSREEVPEYSSLLQQKEKPKVAYLPETLNHEGLQKTIKEQTEQLLGALADDDFVVQEKPFPYLDYIVPAYYVMATAEASSNLARYDGVHFGQRSEAATDLEPVYVKSRTEGFGTEVKRRIMLGTFVLSSGYYDAYYAQAQKVRRIIHNAIESILEEHDIIILPATPTTAFDIGAKTKDPVEMYLQDIFTVLANLTGHPAISLPLGQDDNGLPFGIQVIGRKFDEKQLLAFGNYLMEHRLLDIR